MPGPRLLNSPLVASAALTVTLAAGFWGHQAGRWKIPGLDAAELVTVDARLRLRGQRATADDIVIVGFDDKLRRSHPEVFQRRDGWAALLDALYQHHPKAVGIDALFASPEVPLPEAVVAQVHRAHDGLRDAKKPEDPAVQRAQGALAAVIEATDGDRRLAASIRGKANLALATLFFLERGEQDGLSPRDKPPIGLAGALFDDGVALAGPVTSRPLRAEADTYVSLPMIATATRHAGALNVLRDDDGKVRRVPGVIEQGGRLYAPLGLVMARLASGDELAYVSGERAIAIGERRLPCTAQGLLLLNPLGDERAFPVISAADVLDGAAQAASLRGKLVFLGFTDAARDRVATSLSDSLPGVHVHAALAHNALHGETLSPPPPWAGMLALLLIGLLVTIVELRPIRRHRPWVGSVVGAVAIGLWLVIAEVALVEGVLLEVAAPALGGAVIAVGSLVTALATEGREKARLRRAFGQYVARSLVEKIAQDPGQVRLGGVRRDLTVLFSDIRGFSSFSEGMAPEQLSAFLNEYLTPMSDAVLANEGMLDKYIGDAVMAVYGAPLPLEDHAPHACATALEMVRRLDGLNAQWKARGLPEIAIGVGLNSGEMSVGNMGSDQRFDYTVIGDQVNLAARLEALTKEYSTPILCGPHTAELASDLYVFRELDLVRVKGRGGAVQIYDLLGEVGRCTYTESWLAAYKGSLAAYRQRRWDVAAEGFAQLAEEVPDDGPCRVMLERIAVLRQADVAEGWDGVYEQRSK